MGVGGSQWFVRGLLKGTYFIGRFVLGLVPQTVHARHFLLFQHHSPHRAVFYWSLHCFTARLTVLTPQAVRFQQTARCCVLCTVTEACTCGTSRTLKSMISVFLSF